MPCQKSRENHKKRNEKMNILMIKEMRTIQSSSEAEEVIMKRIAKIIKPKSCQKTGSRSIYWGSKMRNKSSHRNKQKDTWFLRNITALSKTKIPAKNLRAVNLRRCHRKRTYCRYQTTIDFRLTMRLLIEFHDLTQRNCFTQVQTIYFLLLGLSNRVLSACFFDIFWSV